MTMSTAQTVTQKINMDAPLVTVGTDIPEGTYAGTFVGFGEAKLLESTFKPGTKELRMPAEVAIRLKDGSVEVVDGLISPPDGGKVNRKSNLGKLLKVLANGDTTLWDTAGDKLQAGVTLGKFVGRTCMVAIKMGGQKKDFPTIGGYMAPVDGLKYPTADEVKAATAASEGVPF
jgi:hypothetical protein